MTKKAYIVMTALPPTKGHLALIKFAKNVANSVRVILCTQPHEPFVQERLASLKEAVKDMLNVSVVHFDEEIQQEPIGDSDAEFWLMWKDILEVYGFHAGDFIVASEDYGKKLADVVHGEFIPFDMDRVLVKTKARNVRDDFFENYHMMLPEFQKTLRKTVTVFGCESVGKTTLSREIAESLGGEWSQEWARPYLEIKDVGVEVTQEKMESIHRGQAAQQKFIAENTVDKPLVVQDTDLFSTLGYWRLWNTIEPFSLNYDARLLKSDLYIIPQSNIPFEEDPLRYGGDERESQDQFWIDICEEFELPYVVLQSSSREGRLAEAREICMKLIQSDIDTLNFKRFGREYEA